MPLRAVIAGLAALSDAAPIARTTSGLVQGLEADAVNTFLGIPFAADTSGENRWRPPQPREPWSDVFHATKPGVMCSQFVAFFGGDMEGSEDCLNINVFAPSNATRAGSSLLPSYLFIHGGAMMRGDNYRDGAYDGAALARSQGICVFSVNYRLGALGFMVSLPHGITGNFGLQDQRFSMRWIVENGHSFGCDASRLTIGGESAGAQSVTAHLASPLSAGLFQRAIAESTLGGMLYRDAQNASLLGEAVVHRSGCDSQTKPDAIVACLRQLPVADLAISIVAAEKKIQTVYSDLSHVWGHLLTIVYFWSPTTSTEDLPMPIQEAFATGSVSALPWMLGTNHDEGDMFVPKTPFFKNLKGWEYSPLLRTIFPDDATREAVLKRPEYMAPAPMADATRTFNRLLTDYWFVCADLKLAQRNSKLAKTWTYQFTHPFKPADAAGYGLPEICGKTSTCHSGEMPFVFGNPITNFTSAEEQISNRMGDYWGAFVRGEDLPGWEAAATSSMQFGDGPDEMMPVPEVCAFWDEVGYMIPALPHEESVLV